VARWPPFGPRGSLKGRVNISAILEDGVHENYIADWL
jgi:hypothetical protein